MEKTSELDALIMQHGQEFDSKVNKIIEADKLGTLAYDDAEIIPGSGAVMPTSDEVELSKEDAHNHLLEQMAIQKLAKENAEFRKLSDDAKIKDYMCKSQFYYETNEFFKKNGYEMSGKQKRFTKRAIEKAWNKGKFKITPEQREDILYELNKASQQRPATQAPTPGSESNVSEHIRDLNSLIFRQ